jgi:hypothetical protein
MLGLSGNVRATNLLGVDTKAAYINSSIASEGWGVLSTDGCTAPTLAAINSQIVTIGEDGYGSYAVGDAIEHFLGCTFDVATYAAISDSSCGHVRTSDTAGSTTTTSDAGASTTTISATTTTDTTTDDTTTDDTTAGDTTGSEMVIGPGNHLYFGDSSPDKVAELNADLRLGLTTEELELVPDQGTIVNSQRFGIMWHGGGKSGNGGTLDVRGATELNTAEAIFLNKGQAVRIAVDGADGAKLSSANGVILQFMDDDNPGSDPRNMQCTGVYEEPVEPIEPDEEHDLTRVAEGTDALAVFSNIELAGNFYNSTRGGFAEVMAPSTEEGPADGATTTAGEATTTTAAATTTSEGTPPATDADGEPVPLLVSISKNLGLTFDNSKITGVITASTAVHPQPTITAADYKLLGEVTNTPGAAVNNGVIVVLANGSAWTVTGTSYLTSLTIGEDCSLGAPEGSTLTLKVNGKKTSIKAGTYTGAIELIVE